MPDNLQRPKRRTLFVLLKKEAKQFCLNTALHGYRFIVLPKRMLLERIIWVAICLTSLVVAITLLCKAWFTFQENPTVLLTDSNHHPIWFYDFPAVTICDFNKISRKKAYKLARKLAEKTDVEHVASQLKLLIQLTKLTRLDLPPKNLSDLQDLLDGQNLSIGAVNQMLAYTCNDMLERCLWKGEEQICDSMFEQVKTSDGFCCTFNYFALKNHTFSGTLAKKSPKLPRRVSACGYQTGLEVLITNRPQDYFASYIPTIGHKIIVHNPFYYPDWNSQVIFNPQKTISSISISPTITYCSDEIESMQVETRNCFFPHERQLMYFSQYNYRNCMVECRMNMTKELCNCYPYQYVQNDMRLESRHEFCSLRHIPCLHEHYDHIASSLHGDAFSEHERFDYKNFKYHTFPCGCLPDCKSTEYIAESSSGTLVRDYSRNQPALYGGITLKNHSIVRVFFNDLVGIRIRRDVKFNWHTLLAYYGGLLGLFLGFSFVSGIEVICFFTIRLISDVTRDSRKKKEVREHVKTIPPIVRQRLGAGRHQLYPISDAEVRTTSRFRSVFYIE